MKMDLPELVKKAITSACESGRKLSWKIQENDRETLVQLVWKPEPFLAGNSSKNSEVSSNWNLAASTASKSESHQVMDTLLTYSDANANSENTSGSLKDILKEAHDVTFVTKDDSPGLSYVENGLSKWIPI